MSDNGKLILWIEDDADELEPLIWPLKNAGYTIRIAKDAIDAIREFKSDSFDLIILDILIPTGKKENGDKDQLVGESVLEDIRKIDKNIPVIAVTVVSDAEKLKELNVIRVFIKGSLLASDLLKEINKTLQVNP